MKIAIGVRRLAGISGGTGLVLEQVRQLAATGHACGVYSESLDADAVRQAGGSPLRLTRIPGPELFSRRIFSARVARRARRGKYDLLIGHGDLLEQDVLFIHNLVEREQEILGALGSVRPAPVVRLHQEMFRRRAFRLLIANSELARKDLLDRYGLDPAQVRVAYPGFDPARFSLGMREQQRVAARREMSMDGAFVIGFITSGNFPLRGADILRDSLLQLPDGLRRKIRVLAVGASHNLRSLRGQFDAAGLAESLLLQPRRADVERYYYAADMLFHPARLETFGLVVLEAAACGTPVLTSRAVGASELFRDAGFVCEAPDASLFAPLLANLIESREPLETLRVAQSALAQEYTWARCHRRWLGLLDEAGLLTTVADQRPIASR